MVMVGQHLRVAFDAHNLGLPEGTGIATYTRNFERALLGTGAELHAIYGMATRKSTLDPEIGFFDAFRGPTSGRAATVLHAMTNVGSTGACHASRVPTGTVDRRHLSHRLPRSARIHNASGLFDLASVRFRMTRTLQPVALDDAVDVFHTMCPLPLTMKGVARVCTIHDLIPMTLPFTTLDRKTEYESLVQRIVTSYDMLFATSRSTRDDLVRLFDVPPDRIIVTYQSVDLGDVVENQNREELATFLKRTHGLTPGNYLLFVGAIEPKKNVHRLIEAYLSSRITMPLVIAGPDGWLVESETRLLPNALRRRHIVRVPFSSRAMLMRLFVGARALVCPSLTEGFGLPALEAMHLGCPVVATSAGALPEVCGEAAVYVDPYDVRSISEAMTAVVNNDDLCARLSNAGKSQVSQFSSASFGARLREGYEAALERAMRAGRVPSRN